MNEDKVDYYLRMYIQKDIPITREQANEINEYKCELRNKINNLEKVIEEVRKSLEDYQEYIDEAKEFYSDLEDDDVVKVSNLQILNNQMVRNYDLLQILDKVKGE